MARNEKRKRALETKGESAKGKGKPKPPKPKKKDKPAAEDARKSSQKNTAKASRKKERKRAARTSTKPQSEAEKADRYDLYQQSVQTPQADVEFFAATFEGRRGRKALSLREDFCGTAYLSATWIESAEDRVAIGVDIDREPLAWGEAHNVKALPDGYASRLTLLQANVLEGSGNGTDVTCAMNFSYCVFKTRAELKRYFEVVYAKLAPDGMFFTELYGGLEAVVELEESRDCESFTYVWEQAQYNPIDHATTCYIHFEFEDGSRVDRAFSYDWRLWTIPEIRDLLAEVGFSDTKVYWETTDEDGDGTGEFVPTEREENQESWLVYIVAAK